MRITSTTLRRIIKEELKAIMNEGPARETPAERKERIAAEKEAKKKVDRARGSYYRHQPPDRPETYPGEFAARYMQEDAAMNEEDEDVKRARERGHIGKAFDVEQNKFQLDPEYQEKAKAMRKRVAKMKGKMNEDEDAEDAAEDAAYDKLSICVKAVMEDLMAAGINADYAENMIQDAVRTAVLLAR